MEVKKVSDDTKDLKALCNTVKAFVDKGEYQKCESLIFEAMRKYPHAPEPHNLIGVLLEKQGEHLTAMKHFRAAWALDPTYLPARQNLDCYGTFFSSGKSAYDESDCLVEDKNSNGNKFKIEYDAHGIGRVVRRD